MSCDKSRRVMTYFNSRPSARGDDFKNQFGDMDFISIHAPPRGATCPHCRLLRRVAHFNSRPSARGDLRTVRQPARNVYFNSRPSARGDVSHRPHPRTGLHFNSRPSARGDQRREVRRSARRISIHAPPRGATCRREAGIASNLFQFTPLREGRPSARASRRALCSISIHAPPRGATRCMCYDTGEKHFNSRPSARGDG